MLYSMRNERFFRCFPTLRSKRRFLLLLLFFLVIIFIFKEENELVHMCDDDDEILIPKGRQKIIRPFFW